MTVRKKLTEKKRTGENLKVSYVRLQLNTSAAYRFVASLPREDGSGLGLGEGEVLEIGLVQMSGQSPQVRSLWMHVLQVGREFRQ